MQRHLFQISIYTHYMHDFTMMVMRKKVYKERKNNNYNRVNYTVCKVQSKNT